MAVLVGDLVTVTVTYSRAGPYKVHWSVTFTGSDISFGLCFKLDLMSWVAVGAVCQSVHNAA